MKPHDVSSAVVDAGGELLVLVAFKLPGSLKRDTYTNKVFESSRLKKQKAIAQALQNVEIDVAE